MKWGTDSDASGAASGRSDAGYSYDLRSAPLGSRFLWLVRAIAIGIISFPSSSSRLCFGIRVPIEVGRDFDQRWGTVSTGNGAQFRTKWGAVSNEVGRSFDQSGATDPLPHGWSEHLWQRWFRGTDIRFRHRVRGLSRALFHFLHFA